MIINKKNTLWVDMNLAWATESQQEEIVEQVSNLLVKICGEYAKQGQPVPADIGPVTAVANVSLVSCPVVVFSELK